MKRTIIPVFSFWFFLFIMVISVSAEGSGVGKSGRSSGISSSGNNSRLVLPPSSTSQKVDPFYLKLFEEGKEAWSQGNLLVAIEKLEVAYFGFLKSPSHLIETGIYLIVCHFEVNNHERAAYFESEINSLRIGESLTEFDLPQDLLEKYYEASAYFARLKEDGRYNLSSGQNAAPLMKSETLTTPSKSPYTRIAEKEQVKPKTQMQMQTKTKSMLTQQKQAGLLQQEEPQKKEGQQESLPSKTQAKALTQTMQAQASPSETDYLELARREGKLKKKIQYYMQALRQDPSQIDIYFEMTEAYRNDKKYREAVGLLEYLLQYIPDDHRIYVELADLYVLCKYYDKAIDFCDQALTLYPDDLEISYGLARAFMGKKRYARAASEFRKILQLSPEFKNVPSLYETCRNKIK